MQFNVAQLLKQPVGTSRNYSINEVSEEGLPIEGNVELLRTDRGVLVRGTLKASLKSVCCRCLETFDCPLTFGLEEEYHPTKDVVSGKPLSTSLETGAFTIDGQHVLDLSEGVRQHMLLATPMKPLCCPECAGLCPQCGCNLNYRRCDCNLVPADLRWSKLQDLLLKEEREARSE